MRARLRMGSIAASYARFVREELPVRNVRGMRTCDAAMPPVQSVVELRDCKEHGVFESRQFTRHVWSQCPPCVKKREAEEQQRQEQLRRREDLLRLQRRVAAAAIPPRFSDASFENYVVKLPGQRKALEALRRYAANFDAVCADGTCLLMIGTVGTGKTHLGVSLIRSALEQGFTALYSTVLGAARFVKSTYAWDADLTEHQALMGFVTPDLLVLDEVGLQVGSETELRIVHEIIDGRYQQMRPTVVISNLDINGVRDFIGERALDRLREGDGRVVTFNWPSYRGSTT